MPEKKRDEREMQAKIVKQRGILRALLAGFLSGVLLLAAMPFSVSAQGSVPGITPPSSCEVIQYGTSGRGQPLLAYRFGHGSNVLLMVFAMHGFEDFWDRDGTALVYAAQTVMEHLDGSQTLLLDQDWSVYVLPCVNPDGLLIGYSSNGPGRCTMSYLDSSNTLRFDRGVDMNRSFPYLWQPYGNTRNFNGDHPLACLESKALADFSAKILEGHRAAIAIDVHGWTQQLLTNDNQGTLYQIFHQYFPQNAYTTLQRSAGYFTAYAAYVLGYTACLLEFPSDVNSESQFQASGYSEQLCSGVLDILRQYGSDTGHSAWCPSLHFSDLEPLHQYHAAVDYVLENGWMQGTSATTFSPNSTVDRAMLTAILWRAAGYPAPPQMESADLEDGEMEEPPAPDLEGSGEGGPTSLEDGGTLEGNGTGSPSVPDQENLAADSTPLPEDSDAAQSVQTDPVLPQTGFYDVAEDSWYGPAVQWAHANGLVNGVYPQSFMPDQPVSRRDLSLFLYRYAQYCGVDTSQRVNLYQYSDYRSVGEFAADAVSWCIAAGLLPAVSEGPELQPNTPVQRIELAQILMQYLSIV